MLEVYGSEVPNKQMGREKPAMGKFPTASFLQVPSRLENYVAFVIEANFST